MDPQVENVCPQSGSQLTALSGQEPEQERLQKYEVSWKSWGQVRPQVAYVAHALLHSVHSPHSQELEHCRS